MASQQTPNYKLSRWAGTDRILMEEFNDNWDKIDTALKGNADAGAAETAAREAADTAIKNKLTWIELKTATFQQEGELFSLDLSDIDWNAYEQVRLKIEAKGTGFFYLRFNTTHYENILGSNTTGMPHFVTLWPCHTPETMLAGIFQGNGDPIHFGSTNISFKNLGAFFIHAPGGGGSKIHTGSKITLYGHP